MQSGPGDMPSEELESKKGSEKKDFRIEGRANRKYVDRLTVSEFGETTCNDKNVQQRTRAGEKTASKV